MLQRLKKDNMSDFYASQFTDLNKMGKFLEKN